MRDSDRQSGFPAVRSPFQGRRGDKPRRLQTSWWVRASAALVICAAAVAASYAQTFTTLHSFDGADGENQGQGRLLQASDGNLYGATSQGGTNGWGTVFRTTPTGVLTRLYNFSGYPTGGSFPWYVGLIQSNDGSFYGTTEQGGTGGDCNGAGGCGTVYRITQSGTLTTLYSFCSLSGCTDGIYPEVLVLADDGSFYGITDAGGADSDECELTGGCGTVFKMTPDGTLTTLYRFCSRPNCADGAYPVGLIEATDGNFYGTTAGGGARRKSEPMGYGTVFKITRAGRLATLYSFCSKNSECLDGAEPYAGVIQGNDGNFYGTTAFGGAIGYATSGGGSVFKITPGGTLSTLYSFCSQYECDDGATPYAALVQATDGNFYGTTAYGGTSRGCDGGDSCGTIFKVTPSGALTTLYSFCSKTNCTDGITPYAGLVQDTNGSFYGTTNQGGANFDGTVYSLSIGLGPFVQTQPTLGPVGRPVKILGTNLTGATSVTFNGTAATFTVASPSLITTTVPAGATTGTVQVVTPGGTLSSNVPFRVIQ